MAEGAAATGSPSSVHLTIEGKLVVVGDSNSGKTSIVAAFTKGENNAQPRPSIGVAFSKKTIAVPGVTVQFQVWDTAGQEKFRSINSLYYRGAAAAVVVFDVTSRTSFASVQSWLDELRKLGAPRMITALAANKSDLKTGRAVTTEEGREAAARWGMLYGETSARTGAGILELFKAIAREAPRQIERGDDVSDAESTPRAGSVAGRSGGLQADGFKIVSVDRSSVGDWGDSGGGGGKVGLSGGAAGSGKGGCC